MQRGGFSVFYKIYSLYEKGVEIMIPSDLKFTDKFIPSQYYWISDDHQVVISVARGSAVSESKELGVRLNAYYKGFQRDITRFACSHIAKREINGQFYGEIQYTSSMMGYSFYNRFLLGSYENRELIVTLQYTGQDTEENRHVYENVFDSLKLRANNLCR